MDENFRTKISIEPCQQKIDHENRLISFGSCFSENIGNRLKSAYFQIDINPFGVLYNPFSIAESIKLLQEKVEYTENDIFQANSLWNSFNFSTLFSETTACETLKKINLRFVAAKTNFQLADFVLVTFGTAWIFEYIKDGKVVANCHKLPSSNFRRKRLMIDEIVRVFSEILKKFPQKNFIFTVSPVRHFKDGAEENNHSKAILLLAAEQITQNFGNAHYFPAYEIVNDELRDYRFYAADMLHPSDVAVEYIWQRFGETFFTPETESKKRELEKFSTQLSHHPLHPHSVEYQAFRKAVEQSRQKLIEKYFFLSGLI